MMPLSGHQKGLTLCPFV